MSQGLPSFDLVVATVGRSEELRLLLESVEAQGYPNVRVLVVDQNEDGRTLEALDGRTVEVVRFGSAPGLSRARNVALDHVTADIVAFPDDDCVYPPGLLETVAAHLSTHPRLDGLTGRAEDDSGRSSTSWRSDSAMLTWDNLWNRAISFTIFLRREVVERVGRFDERLGLGSAEPWSSGEETDYLIRAVRQGARIEYDPSLIVRHRVSVDDARIGLRDGASVGYLLRKHGYSPRVVARMLIRPVGGALRALLRHDVDRARFYAASFRGRLRGYVGATRSKISA